MENQASIFETVYRMFGIAMEDYIVKRMTRSELDLAVDWAALEGWNPGLHDADCFYTTDPNGFLIGLLAGEPIASISVVKYGETFGFLGFYIVRPEFRGYGYGLKIWQAGLDYLHGRNIGLDGVIAQQENYRQSGFTLAYRNIRYEGIGAGARKASLPSKLVSLKAISINTILDYDRHFFPSDRAHFLTAWVTQPEHYGVGFMHQGNLVGYGILRPCRKGYKIGPLFANTPAIAEDLFQALMAQINVGIPFQLDVPAVNSQAMALAERHNMRRVFETTRMYTQTQPDLSLERTFGITTFELG